MSKTIDSKSYDSDGFPRSCGGGYDFVPAKTEEIPKTCERTAPIETITANTGVLLKTVVKGAW